MIIRNNSSLPMRLDGQNLDSLLRTPRTQRRWIQFIALALLLPLASFAQLTSTQQVATGFAAVDHSVATLSGWVRPEQLPPTQPLTFSSAFTPYQQPAPYTIDNSLLPNVEGWGVNGG